MQKSLHKHCRQVKMCGANDKLRDAMVVKEGDRKFNLVGVEKEQLWFVYNCKQNN